ncbi:MAG TPA: BspA family leucine-rich repeat surface protein, partial [Pseudomonadales bacterium]|nr:BspA family leucine-rich repeat surface protein [Pseudomonadales bacterium]
YSPGAAADARAVLTGATNGWTITDGGESSVFTVSTLAVSDIAATSATAGGNITADGGSPITVRGMVWGTSENPTIETHTGITTDGSGTGAFTSSITGLAENTTYYVRAYATNADGTEYGKNKSFTAMHPMVLEFNTKLSDGTSITLPLNGTVDAIVDWGDGNSNNYTTAGSQSHTYADEGTYIVSITGELTHFGKDYPGTPNIEKLVAVTNFGGIKLISLQGAFYGAINLIQVPTIIPPTVTDMAEMFAEATSFNQGIGDWDVSKVSDMSYMFVEATTFNQDIGGWNVTNVTDMAGMFAGATSFNQNISNWNVSNVTDMEEMFADATAFNQDINNWDVSKVADMSYMFAEATSFNQDIGGWNVSNVTDMADMFQDVTLSTANYNSLLIGWAAQTVQNGVVFSCGNSTYSPGAAADAKAKLIDTYSWTITDGGELSVLAVSTLAVSDIAATSAIAGGNVTADGGSPVTARGVIWGTSANPTIETHTGITADGDGLGTFTSNITGLTENTTYHVRAYATNADGTEYGVNREFTTDKVTSIGSLTQDNLKLYPNPFQSTINITNANNVKRVVITNVVGKVVMVVDLNQLSNEVIETNVPSGLYLVTLIANDGSRVVRKMVRD